VTERLPAHLEISGLIRAVQNAGGFATVLAKGERDAGTILVICREAEGISRAFERMPHPDGTRSWALTKSEDIEKKEDFKEYLDRRRRQDSDLWILELDIVNGERFIR
jgi:hypothetical protein